MSEIYEPAEDSFLLSETLKDYIKKNKINSALEVGCGSGIQLQVLKEAKIKKILGVDINPKAVKHCKNLGFNVIESDLFEKIKDKFDLIIFNPPYLPYDEKEPESSQTSTTGGIKGSEIINEFLSQAYKHLKDTAKILLLCSSLTKGINLKKYNKKILSQKKLFFERLYVYELWKKQTPRQEK